MGDVQSGMASTIMQVYLKHVLEAFFTGRSQVRLEALNVIQLVLKQGLIHPVQVNIMSAVKYTFEKQLRTRNLSHMCLAILLGTGPVCLGKMETYDSKLGFFTF